MVKKIVASMLCVVFCISNGADDAHNKKIPFDPTHQAGTVQELTPAQATLLVLQNSQKKLTTEELAKLSPEMRKNFLKEIAALYQFSKEEGATWLKVAQEAEQLFNKTKSLVADLKNQPASK